jgi:DNA-binding transcriptional LysR family regulator
MELRWLEDYLAVAKLRNFSQAAVARHSTQPAFSRRIKALEVWYGASLLDRSTYPVTLTVAGTRFLALAEQVVSDLYRSRREARAAPQRMGPTLKFAMPHSLAAYFFPKWWRAQASQHAAKATVIAADLHECVELLISGLCQFVICYRHEGLPNGLSGRTVHGACIGTTTLVPVSAVDARGKPLFSLRASARKPLPVLSYTNESYLGKVTRRLYTQVEAQRPLVLQYESALVEALKAEALLGEGVAWLPEGMIEAELQTGALRIIGGADCTAALEIWLCRPSAAGRGAAEEAYDFIPDARRYPG